MNNAEILQAAIDKAYTNGWQTPLGKYEADSSGTLFFHSSIGDFEPLSIYQVIYDHGFAKALWGEDLASGWQDDPQPDWEINLMHMVIASDPLQYLGEHLNG